MRSDASSTRRQQSEKRRKSRSSRPPDSFFRLSHRAGKNWLPGSRATIAGIHIFAAQPSGLGGSHEKLGQRALCLARMANPALTGVHAGECEICRAAAEEKKITAAARAAFTFPTEDIPDPSTWGPGYTKPWKSRQAYPAVNRAKSGADGLLRSDCRMLHAPGNYPAAQASGSLITSTSTNSLTFLVRSLPNT